MGGFKYFLFSPTFGEMIQFDYIYFLIGLKPPTRQFSPLFWPVPFSERIRRKSDETEKLVGEFPWNF